LSGWVVLAIFRAWSSRLTWGAWLRAFLPLLLWAAVVWLIGGLDEVPGGDADVTKKLDKLAHLVMYGALGFLCGRAWRLVDGRAGFAVVLILLGLALGATDERRQLGIAGRTGSAADWFADAAGVLGGFVLAASHARQRQRT
jgi:VanZ family protein